MKVRHLPGSLFFKEPLLAVVLFALAMLMAIIIPAYIYTSYREQQLDLYGVTATGTVVSAEPGCSNATCQKVEVSYAVEGEEYLLQANTNPNDPQADVGLSAGQNVQVRYDPAHPQRARLLTLGESEAGFFRFMIFFCLFVLGAPAVLLAARLLWRVRKT